MNYRKSFMVLIHSLLIFSAYATAFLIRFDLNIRPEYWKIILRTSPLLLTIKISVFWYYRLFSGLWRFASIEDVWRIIKANIVSSVFFIVAVLFAHNTEGYPRSVFVIDLLMCMCLTGMLRFAARFREIFRYPGGEHAKRKVIVVGAGEAGVVILREARNNPSMETEVVGFIDDDPAKKNLRIQGVKILGTRYDIADSVSRTGAQEVIIAIPSAKGEVIRDIIAQCQIPGIKLKIVPGLHKLFSGDLEIKPRDVRPEDLLGRETVQVNRDEICSYLRDKRVLVTGAGGSIGSELCRHIVEYNPQEIVLFDFNENNVYFLGVEFATRYPNVRFKTVIGDIKDIGLLKRTFSRYKPQVVFHAAAHKHVPLMEENPSAAVKNNIIGSRNLIYASDHYRVERFVLISTDKAVNPSSVMGATKRVAEMILQSKARSSKTKFIAVRFGNVLGSDGSVVPLFKKQIEDGGPITVTDPQARRYFMSIREATDLVLQAGAFGKGGEIFILDMGEQIKIVDLAKNLITFSGLQPDKDIQIKFIGLRPGEKLSEELLLDAEKDKSTQHRKIFVTQSNGFNSREILRHVKELEIFASRMEDRKIISKLGEMIPSCKFAKKA